MGVRPGPGPRRLARPGTLSRNVCKEGSQMRYVRGAADDAVTREGEPYHTV